MIIDYQGTPIHVDVYGKGAPVVLIHGFLEERSMWNKFIPVLEKNHRVVRMDLFGHGETPLHSKIGSIEEMADSIVEIMNKLEIDAVSLIGHSMGGYISMALLAQIPDKIQRILLLNSTPKPDNAKRLEERNQVIKIVRKHKTVFVKTAVSNLFAEESKEKFSSAVQERIEAALQMKVDSIISAVEAMKNRVDRERVLHNFSGRKWIVGGEDDALISITSLQEVQENTGAKLFELSGGHMSYIEQEEKVRSIFQDFLKD